MKHPLAKVLLAVFALIHLSFYVSATATDHLQHFFVEGTIQDEKTLDFSQIPNGAQTFFEGGEISGEFREYPVLINYYHPATTLLLGGFLQIFDIPASFMVYLEMKMFLTVLLVVLLYRHHSESENFVWALFVFLTFFIQGVDIGCGQYHFLLNLFIFLFLFALIHARSTWQQSCFFFGSLMIKPVGLLWVPQLLMERRYRLVIGSLGTFIVLTAACWWWIPGGRFYVTELLHYSKTHIEHVADGIPTDGGRYTLETILRYLGVSATLTQIVKFSLPVVILAVCYRCRIPLFAALFLWTCYYLLFYSRVYIYHYTTLIPFFTLGVLTQPQFQGRFVKAMIVVSCLPSPYFLYKLFDIFVEGSAHGSHRNVTSDGFFIMICLRVLPVLLIAVYIVLDSWKQRSIGTES
ncbi:MAG: DUF2029 domain-containing protein [Planctomycetes bacterium]|nr:DUF2029 domain-containing protein [Planctomycetota bacterium]